MNGQPTVAELWRFPVKSMQGERLSSAVLTSSGIEGDRSFALRDQESGKVLSAKRWEKLLQASARLDDVDAVVVTLPGGESVDSRDGRADATLSEWFGRPVALVRADPAVGAGYESAVDPLDPDSPVLDFPCPPGTFQDAAALHLMSTSALEWARALQPGSVWDQRRFRPGVVVSGGGEGHVEESWIGQSIAMGSAVVMPFAPCVRCALPTRPQPALPAGDGGPELAAFGSDKSVLGMLRDRHNTCLGVYATVVEPGTLSVGDPLVSVSTES